ncbi:M91 family zinc metallopeptidase, partial [Empedobacter brevis]|uniref:M91 family zinc metallopeptidase n=1 Tax=Empedobacter brevis TaxID=247 RepID=UPI002FE39CC7
NYVYNLTDHLGNVRVSYAWDDVNSKLKTVNEDHYYPFGLQHKGYNKPPVDITIRERERVEIGVGIGNTSGSANYKYRYNGKELQDELNLNIYAYGWRDYDPAIGRFSKIDRFADKYYSISPYAYAANNPVRFMDVKGDSLWIEYKGNKILYENGNLRNQDGTAYTGKGVKIAKDGSVKLKGFLKNAVGALDKLNSKDVGNSIVDQLQGSSENYTIVRSSRGNYYNSGTNEVGFDPSARNSAPDQKGNTGRPTFVGLGHELGHGVDDDSGTLDRTVDTSFGYRNTEKFATHIENQIRAEHGLSLRTHYGQDASGNWNGPLLRGNTNQSLHYPGFIYGGVTPLSIQPAGLSIPMTAPSGNVLPTINRIP